MRKVRRDSPDTTPISPSRLPLLESRRAKSSELDELKPVTRIQISLEDDCSPSRSLPNRKMLWLDPVYKISVTSPAFSRSYDGVPKIKKSPIDMAPQSPLLTDINHSNRNIWRPTTTPDGSINEEFAAKLERLKAEQDPAALAKIEALHNEFLNRSLHEVIS